MGEHSEASCFLSLILHLFLPLSTLTVFQKHFRKLVFSCNSILLQSLQKKKKKRKATCWKLAGENQCSYPLFLSSPFLSCSFFLFFFLVFLRNYLVHIPESRVKVHFLFMPFFCPIPTPTFWWPQFLVNYIFFRVSYAWTSR